MSWRTRIAAKGAASEDEEAAARKRLTAALDAASALVDDDAPGTSTELESRRRRRLSQIRLLQAIAGRTRDLGRPVAELFDLPADRTPRDGFGAPLATSAHRGAGGPSAEFVPDVDLAYLFDPDLLKTALMALELDVPLYLWGHAGVGKSTIVEQICARLRRPMIRVQHTINMEEAHALGQYGVADGRTVWQDGPLPFAMRRGFVYLADEYDFAMPHVLGLYQPVLEGKPLVIKEAPEHLRIVRPHADFHFCATGNTNGAGDDTGLYQGVNLQNFANFERFGVMAEVRWMPTDTEIAVVRAQARIPRAAAAELVRYAGEVRRAHDAGKIGATISPRALINAGRIAARAGGLQHGVTLAFVNRLGATDREICGQIAQRVFG